MATNQQLLLDAQASYHKLMTGTAARVVVDQNGERVEFAVANAAKLYSYIQDLQARVAAEIGAAAAPSNAPLQFFF